jgi:two-component system sensor histidine kinase AgrC
MNTPVFVMLRASSLFLLAFLWLLLPHRYGKFKSLLILLCCFAATCYPDYEISCHVVKYVDMDANYFNLLEILIVIITALIFSSHRDDRAVFGALSASTYELAGITVGSIIYYHSQSSALSMGIQVIFYVLLLAICCRKDRSPALIETTNYTGKRAYLCFVPALSYLSIYAAAAWPGNIFLNQESRVLAVIMVFLMFAYYFLVSSLLNIQKKSCRLARNNELLETYAANLERQMEKDRENQEKMAILRHDIRHRENMILYYLDDGDTEAIRSMLGQMSDKLNETVQKKYCSNKAMNLILADTERKAAENGVAFECAAEISELPGGIRTDFATVILNLLENALKAASKVPEKEKRFVKFEAKQVKSNLAISVSNSYTGELRFALDTGLPVSMIGGEHGYGLRSVLAFSDKYSAPYDCSAEDGVFTFRILIPERAQKKITVEDRA